MTKKIAISLPDKALARAKAAVKRGKAPTVSNYIASLIEQESANESFEEMIADWLRASGATEEQIRSAEREALSLFKATGLMRANEDREEKASRKAR